MGMEDILESGFCSVTGIYNSPLHPAPLHSSHFFSLPEFLLCATHRHPLQPAFVDAVSAETLTYADLKSLTFAAARALRDAGVGRGDVVLLISPNCICFPALSLGIMAAGAVFSTANHLQTRREIQAQVEDSSPVLILTTRELHSKLDGLITRPPLLIDQFLSNLPIAESEDLLSVFAGGRIEQDDAAALMYSSGTTGRSKGVVCTHRNLVYMAGVLRHVWGDARRDIYLCAVPLFHMFGFSVFVCGAVASGAEVVVMQRYSIEGMLEAVERRQVTRIPAVPPMVVQLTRMGHLAGEYELKSLREVICSGAPLAKKHIERFTICYPHIVLSQCYGLTESCGPVTLCDGVEGRFHLSIGRLIPSVEAKIVHILSRDPLPPNQSGELCIRGPSIMRGYLNNTEATSLAIDEEGWLRTGDLCYIDNRGLLYVVDRIKELIKYKAYQVAPVELEEILSAHPGVADVAVISHPDEEAGEIPMACVVRKAGFEMHKDELIAFVDDKVAPYKRIREVMFVDYIPRSPSGKIIRRRLKGQDFMNQKPEISARL